MKILGIQGSPRKKGNTADLLSLFMEEARAKYSAKTEIITPHTMDIQPCRELIICEKKGFCPIKDDMDRFVYKQLKNADIVVLAAPVFFYSFPAQTKALIDRCQMFWGRKYKLKLKDPKLNLRKGFLLSCGASGGKKLFDGLELTAKIFFDALSITYEGSLTYRHIESPGQMASHSDVRNNISKGVKELCEPALRPKTILFVSKHDALRSKIAASFFKQFDEDKWQVFTAGVNSLEAIYPETVEIMAEKHLDLMHVAPVSLEQIDTQKQYSRVVFFGKDVNANDIQVKESITWDISAPVDRTPEQMKQVRDCIEKKVAALFL